MCIYTYMYISIIHTIYVKSYYHICVIIYNHIYIYIYTHTHIIIYIDEICHEELAHTVMEADKSQELQGKSANWRPQES